MLKFKHFWNYHSISPNQLTISFCWFKFTWMCFTNFHEKHRQLRVGGSCLWSPTKTWAIREVWQLLGSSQEEEEEQQHNPMWVARPGAVLLPILLGKIWNSWWNAWWNSCRSITARYFIRILCDQWIFRTVLGKYQWLNGRRISLLSTPKLPCEYTRYSFCLGLRVIYYQTYLLSEPVICNWQDVWIGARYSGSGCTAKFEGLKRNLRWNPLEISNQGIISWVISTNPIYNQG